MTHQQMIDVIKHHMNGGNVEFRHRIHMTDFETAIRPCWDFQIFEYRIAEEPKKTWWVNRYKNTSNCFAYEDQVLADGGEAECARTDRVEVQAATAEEAERIAKEMPWPEEPFMFEGLPLKVGDKLWDNELKRWIEILELRKDSLPLVAWRGDKGQVYSNTKDGRCLPSLPIRLFRNKPEPKKRNLRPDELPSVFILLSPSKTRFLTTYVIQSDIDAWEKSGCTWSPLMPTRAQEVFKSFRTEDV